MSTGEEQARTDQFKINKLGSSRAESMETETEAEDQIFLLLIFFFGSYFIGIYNRHELWVRRKLRIVVTVEAELFTVVAVTGKVH